MGVTASDFQSSLIAMGTQNLSTLIDNTQQINVSEIEQYIVRKSQSARHDEEMAPEAPSNDDMETAPADSVLNTNIVLI